MCRVRIKHRVVRFIINVHCQCKYHPNQHLKGPWATSLVTLTGGGGGRGGQYEEFPIDLLLRNKKQIHLRLTGFYGVHTQLCKDKPLAKYLL